MSEEMNNNVDTQTREYVLETDLPAYMNRKFCSTKERVVYILKTATAELNFCQENGTIFGTTI